MTKPMPDPADNVACRVCGNSRGNRSFTAREMMFGSREEFLYYECAGCDCLWIANVPDDLSRHYGSDYYSLRPSSVRLWVKRQPALYWVAYFATARKLPQLPEWWPVEHARPGARVLDVGSGVGHFLLHLKALGYKNLVGIDPFVERDIRMRNGPTILKRSIAETHGQFDVIVMDHSFEHIASPDLVFGELKRLLAPSGTAVIRTPVASGQAWRTYGADWVQLDAPRHLFIHTVKSISVLAQANGLRLEKTTYDSTAFQYWGSEQYRRDIPLRDRRSVQSSVSKSIFSRRQMEQFSREASELNKRGEGDQACFYLRSELRASV